MAERDIVGNYLGMDSKKRMDYIYKNYRNFKAISDAYMDSVAEMIASMREYERRHSQEDLGVRVQTSRSMSSVFCNNFWDKVANHFWTLLHVQIGQSCKGFGWQLNTSRITVADI